MFGDSHCKNISFTILNNVNYLHIVRKRQAVSLKKTTYLDLGT